MPRRTSPAIEAAPGGDGVLDDGQIDRVIALAEKGADGSNESSQGRGRKKPDVLAPKVGERDETPTEVICVVENRPWTDKGPLTHKQRVKIPKWVADLMAAKGQVVIV